MDSHGLNILVDPREARRNKRPLLGEDMLARWVCEKVNYWEEYRNTNDRGRWDEYYRIWRTEWSEDDKERMVERSRIMPTDLSEAVNKVTAELTDAFFGREVWFDASDDDPNPEDVKEMASRLRFDAEKWGVKQGICDALFFGALYGTGIVKIGISEKEYAQAVQLIDDFGRPVLSGAATGTEPCVTVTAISPREFVVQPGALSVKQSLGVAQITMAPVHQVHEGQRKGYYRAGEVGTAPANWKQKPWDVETTGNRRDSVKLIEYHGMVPKALLPGSKATNANKSAITNDEPSADVEMVEAIVLVANDSLTLKAVENPYIPARRSVFAFQFERVPDSFWGRGVVEMGYHPYKALQTEIRARADGLALANYPTIWRDQGSLSSDEARDDPEEKIIAPGKEYLVSGDPNRAIREFKFSGPDRGSSQAIADYQRMIEAATGSFGFQGALLSSKDTTVAGASTALQSFLRRNKQTAQNIESDLISPVIEAMAWRAMQFLPERYPPADFSFSAKGALGVLQRDAERATLVELLGAIAPESAAFYAILRQVVEDGPYKERAELMAIMDSMIAQALTPPAPPPDPAGEARLISAQHRITEHQDEMQLAYEKLKREDVDLLIKAKGGSSANESTPDKPQEEVNININSGNKRVKIRRTDDGLVGETEEI